MAEKKKHPDCCAIGIATMARRKKPFTAKKLAGVCWLIFGRNAGGCCFWF